MEGGAEGEHLGPASWVVGGEALVCFRGGKGRKTHLEECCGRLGDTAPHTHSGSEVLGSSIQGETRLSQMGTGA